jgi:hypothetical protein
MSEPVYGVEVTYQSGKVTVMHVSTERSTVDLFYRMATTLIGRVDPIDGVVAVRLVVAHPNWEESEEPVVERSTVPIVEQTEASLRNWSQCYIKRPHRSHIILSALEKNTWCRGILGEW